MKTMALLLALWVWDPVPNADGYRFYWTTDIPTDPTQTYPNWFECQRCETTGNSLSEAGCPGIAIDPQPGELIIYTVTAFNEHGESSTGWAPGTTHGEIFPCP